MYNNAGLEYADAGDHRTALDWLTDGLRLALRTSDPERLVDQLVDLRQASLDSLGQPADALQEQAMMFLREQKQARQQRSARTGQRCAGTHRRCDRLGGVGLATHRRLRAGGDVVA